MAITDNLAWGYKLDETSGNALDVLSTNDLTDTNSCGTTTGRVSTARTFNGSTQYFKHASAAVFQFGDIDWTIWGWFNANSFPSRATLVGKSDANTHAEYDVYTTGTGAVKVEYGSGSVTSSNTASTGSWFFWAARYDSTINTLYVRLGTTYTSVGGVTGGTTDGNSFYIGAEQISDAGGAIVPFDGAIDEVYGAKRLWSDADLDTVYNGNAGLAYPWSVAAVDMPYDLAHQPQHQAIMAI